MHRACSYFWQQKKPDEKSVQQNPTCATCFMGSMDPTFTTMTSILPTRQKCGSPVLGPVRRLEANTSDESDIQIEAYQSANGKLVCWVGSSDSWDSLMKRILRGTLRIPNHRPKPPIYQLLDQIIADSNYPKIYTCNKNTSKATHIYYMEKVMAQWKYQKRNKITFTKSKEHRMYSVRTQPFQLYYIQQMSLICPGKRMICV